MHIQYPHVRIVDSGSPETRATEARHVSEYQAGWNDAQQHRAPRAGATLYYNIGYADAGGRLQ